VVTRIYARKSTDEPDKTEEDRSCAKQIEHARAFAKQKGWRVDEGLIFRDDAVSGGEFKRRPGLQDLLASIKKKPGGALIVRNQSRLGRDYRRVVALGVEFEDAGVEVFSYQTGKRILHQDDGQEMQEFIEGKSDERKLLDTARDTHDGLASNAAKGKPTGGKRYGYKSVPTGEIAEVKGRRKVVTKLVFVPAEKKVVLLIFQLREKGWGHHRIAHHLNQEKVPTPRPGSLTRRKGAGGVWEKAKSTGLWKPSQVRVILNNPIYAGRVMWGRTVSKRLARAGVKPEPRTDIDERLRIVPEPLWRRVQKINEAAADLMWRGKGGHLKSRPVGKNWLTRFIRCGLCGGSMRIRWERRKDSDAQILHCSNAHIAGKRGCAVTRRLPAKAAEREIRQKFPEAFRAGVVLAKLEEWVGLRREAKDHGKADRRKLEAERDTLTQDIANLIKLGAKNPTPEIRAEIDRRSARVEEINGQLKAAEVLADFEPRLLRDAIEAVTEDYERQLKRKPELMGQVLGKILKVKMSVTPGPGRTDPWEYVADVDYQAILEEADADVAEAVQALARELDVDLGKKPGHG